ncbi:T-cell surface antigen CD2 [Python bivittatus]|uniref:T-cell surface antigen CD2 n=1 Tax=Python bivittatus TaxID=176946 RepID=A0A9F5N7G3_PYTBI|nr:T-cell surface antigen CD2 [Python bivittatus]
MNVGNPFLIKFLIILFSLKGSVSTIHGRLGSQIILSALSHSGEPHFIQWTKGSTLIAECLVNSNNSKAEQKEYHAFCNGSLKINTLKKKDAGNYEVEIFDKGGKRLHHEIITLQVDELLLQPKLIELCSKRILKCEVKSSEKPKPRFKLFQNTQETETFQGPVYDNATWKVTLQLKVLSGKFRCEIEVNSEKNHTEKEITCAGQDFPHSIPMFLILAITGGVVTLIVFMALIIYCIRKKKAKRREREAQEHALQVQIESHMQQRKLPQIPAYSDSNPPAQKSRLPPPCSELQQQNGPLPPKSCPHPKPPRRMKERP